MSSSNVEATVRPMNLQDLDMIFTIDHQIRREGKAVTYANITTERIFSIDRHVGRLARPVGYVDLIKGDVSELLELGVVAEIEDHVRGFILGRIAHVGQAGTEMGIIPILGVHPDYQRRGIATKLVDAICDKFRSRGIKRIRIDVDRHDKDLLAFVEHMGLGAGRLVEYSKSL
jgi:ribosomal protein S18 acetylase RimI-like enzyme